MSWDNDHDHRGDYAPARHDHDSYEVHGAAEKHHDHAGTYSHTSHDHDRSDIWSALTDLQNSVDDIRKRVATLAALAAANEASSP